MAADLDGNLIRVFHDFRATCKRTTHRAKLFGKVPTASVSLQRYNVRQEISKIMEFSKRETQVLILAISIAIEKESRAVAGLECEVQQIGISAAIAERTRTISELNKLRKRIRAEQN